MSTEPKKKILVITPRFPYPEAGACEQERSGSLRQLQRLGFDVHVVAKYFDWQPHQEIVSIWTAAGVEVELIPYKYKKATETATQRLKKYLQALTHPWYLDGSVLEYQEPEMVAAVTSALDRVRPDIVWIDYTYLWPLYRLVRERGLPLVVRSINFEALHYLDEDGRSLLHWLKSLPKFLTEFITARAPDAVFSITPRERTYYERLHAKRVVNVPLRSLQDKFGTHTPHETQSLRVYFTGSTYTVTHNRRALEFILKEVAPAAWATFGDRVTFHIFGAKFPSELRPYIKNNVSYDDRFDQFFAALETMDVALAPSLFGAGMQQKIFEPLARGFPTITHERGIAGYDFENGRDVLFAETVPEYLSALEKLQSYEFRQQLSDNAKAKSLAQFSEPVIDVIVGNELNRLLK